MRQNGLRASSFVAVADVDPRIADQLLDLMAFAHVAAYAEPVPGRVGVYRDHHVPTRPIDRLWVDREATGAAREVLDRSLAHLHAELETAIAEGVLAAGTVAADRRGSPAGGTAPVTAAPPDAVPVADVPAQPVDATPVGSAPVGVVPVDALPVDALPVDALPVDALPVDAGPVDAGPVVPGALSPGSVSVGDTAAHAVQDRRGDGGDMGPTDGTGGGVSDETPGTGPTRDDSSDTHEDRPATVRPPHHDEDLDQAAVDARWQEIVAGWDGPPAQDRGPLTPPTRRGSASEPPPHPLGSRTSWPLATPPAPQPADRRRTDRGPVDPARRRNPRSPGVPTDPPGPRDHTLVPEEDHFSPPLPVRHPPLEKTTRLGWAGMVLGVVLLVVVVAIGADTLPRWLPLLAVALLVGGFVALVSRLHRSPPDEDDHDPDDGAVV